MALEALQPESDKVEAEKKQLAEGKKDVDELKGKMESLSMALEGLKAVEQLALERAQKANDATTNLHREVDVERESSRAPGA